MAIARALVGSPRLLLCDEPTGNLDSKTSANLLDLLAKLNKEGLTLVIVTHDENVANRASRRVHIIDVPFAKAVTCIAQWGVGSSALLAALHAQKEGKPV